MRPRRRAALAIAVGATVYLTLTAAIVVIPGFWLPPPVTMFTSPVPAHVLALIAAAVTLQLGVTVAWARRAALKRRYLGGVAAVEVVLGASIFSLAPVLRGSGAAPEPGSEPIYLMPAWSLWGLLCLSFVGLLMIAAVIVHGSSSRHAAGTAESGLPAA
ncbi:hypothetical protein BH24CHL5_BH24CHL5_04150 [soil metagenome]